MYILQPILLAQEGGGGGVWGGKTRLEQVLSTFSLPLHCFLRHVYNVGCREFKRISLVRGATRYTATMIGGGGGDRYVSNAALGWAGYNG